MTIGGSILLGVIGAVLRYAVADQVDNVDLRLVGLILMVAAAIGLVLGIFLEFSQRSRGTVVSERIVEERRPPL